MTKLAAPTNNKKNNMQKARKIILDRNNIGKPVIELINIYEQIHAEDLWKMSNLSDDIEAFYQEIKKLIEKDCIMKESDKKGYLEKKSDENQ